MNGHLSVVQYLISIQPQFPNIDPCAKQNEAIRMAAMNGRLSIVQYLISIRNQFPNILLGIENAIAEAEEYDHSQIVECLQNIPPDLQQKSKKRKLIK